LPFVLTDPGLLSYQEDRFTIGSIHIDPSTIQRTIDKVPPEFQRQWDPRAVGDEFASQVLFVGIYDGHGGHSVSEYLHTSLHDLFEHIDVAEIPDLVAYLKTYGGYFRRFRGGALQPWAVPGAVTEEHLDLEAHATYAFLQADREISKLPDSENCGATSSVALIQTLDEPSSLFYNADNLLITVAHCGDTRAILCNTDATTQPLTANHHADERTEETRLRRVGGGIVTDSFGDTRWMGALANTRCLGDLQYKSFGVTPEPEVKTRIIEGHSVTALVLMSDGISSLLSDPEIADLVRTCAKLGPEVAAREVVRFAEELGAEDNCTAVVVPLKGWNTRVKDTTKELREFRRTEAMNSERLHRM